MPKTLPDEMIAKHEALKSLFENEEQRLETLTKNQSLALKVANKTKSARAAELMKKWDLQGTGVVNMVDFRTNIRNLGLKAEVSPTAGPPLSLPCARDVVVGLAPCAQHPRPRDLRMRR